MNEWIIDLGVIQADCIIMLAFGMGSTIIIIIEWNKRRIVVDMICHRGRCHMWRGVHFWLVGRWFWYVNNNGHWPIASVCGHIPMFWSRITALPSMFSNCQMVIVTELFYRYMNHSPRNCVFVLWTNPVLFKWQMWRLLILTIQYWLRSKFSVLLYSHQTQTLVNCCRKNPLVTGNRLFLPSALFNWSINQHFIDRN